MDLDRTVEKIFWALLLPIVLAVVAFGVWTCVQGLTAEHVTAGQVQGKFYGGNPCTYRLKVADGGAQASLPVPKSVFEDAEEGDWYDSDGVVLTRASDKEVSIEADDEGEEDEQPAYAAVPSTATAIAALAAAI